MKVSPFHLSPALLRLGEIPEDIPHLIRNEIVQGTVLKSLDGEDILLLIKGKCVKARTAVPLVPGKAVSFRVGETRPVPVLKLLGTKFEISDAINPSKILSAFKDNLWKSAFEHIERRGLSEGLFSQFRAFRNDMTERPFLEPNPGLLQTVIDKSGLNWEAKLKKAIKAKALGRDSLSRLLEGDLKGQVSRLLSRGDEKGMVLKRLVSVIEHLQLLNHLEGPQDKKVFLPVPMQFFDGQFAVGQLMIQVPRKWKGDQHHGRTGALRVSFLLELSQLGPLRADFVITGKEIRGTFLLAGKNAKAIVQKNIPAFVSRVRQRGFSVNSMECLVKDQEILGESILKEMIQGGGHSISLVA